MYRINIVLIFLLCCSCDMPIEPQNKDDIYINSYQINFDESSNELYVVLNFTNYESIDSVLIEFSKSDSILYSFSLNDNGLNGDILPQNGSFSMIENIPDFEYGEYYLNYKLIDNDENSINNSFMISIFPNNFPSIVDVQISDIYYLDPLNWTNLNISVLTTDIDGLEDINYVRYMINTDYLTQDDESTQECDHYNIPEDQYNGYISDPSWIMEYNSTINNSIYQFVTSIPMRPSIECGGYGVVFFQFIIEDKAGETYQYENEVLIEILSCGDGTCSYESPYNECSLCEEDCIGENTCEE